MLPNIEPIAASIPGAEKKRRPFTAHACQLAARQASAGSQRCGPECQPSLHFVSSRETTVPYVDYASEYGAFLQPASTPRPTDQSNIVAAGIGKIQITEAATTASGPRSCAAGTRWRLSGLTQLALVTVGRGSAASVRATGDGARPSGGETAGRGCARPR